MLLEIDDLVAGYGKADVVQSVTLEVGDGEQVGLFGPNGHGKTTILRAVSGLIHPRAGDIRFNGESIVGLLPGDLVERGLIHVPQGNTLFPRMTVLETLTLGAYTKRSRKERSTNLDHVLQLFPKLADRKSQRVHTLSGGERQMLAIGVGLMGMPRILMLDEPTLGLAPKAKDELTAAISAIGASGVPMLAVDQDMALLLKVCQRLYLIEKGTVSFESKEGDSVERADVFDMYFGRRDR